jgi:hypothetical protein
MPRIDLDVPFRDKDAARRLGARWDADARRWFVPASLDPTPFARWLPGAEAVNVRAPRYFIATSSRPCERCLGLTRVHGFLLPADHETLYADDDTGLESWEAGTEPTLLCFVDYLAPAVAARMRAVAPGYRLAASEMTGGPCWLNHCEHCHAPLGDEETFCEPGGGFLAFTPEEAARITLDAVEEPFAASCGSYSIGVGWFEELRRA